MVCGSCGIQVPEGSVFCLKCGSKINTAYGSTTQPGSPNQKQQKDGYRSLVGTTWSVCFDNTYTGGDGYSSIKHIRYTEITFEQHSRFRVRVLAQTEPMEPFYGSDGTWKQDGENIRIEMTGNPRVILEGKLIAENLIALRERNDNTCLMLINF